MAHFNNKYFPGTSNVTYVSNTGGSINYQTNYSYSYSYSNFSEYERQIIMYLQNPNLTESKIEHILETLTLGHGDDFDRYDPYTYSYSYAYKGYAKPRADLSSDFIKKCLCLIGSHPTAHINILNKIINLYPPLEVVDSIVYNPSTPQYFLTNLYHTQPDNIKSRISEITIDPTIIENCISNPNSDIRLGVALNKNISREKLSKLVFDDEYRVREATLTNPMFIYSDLTYLANDPIDYVRSKVSEHKLMDLKLIKMMYAKEKNEELKQKFLDILIKKKNIENFK